MNLLKAWGEAYFSTGPYCSDALNLCLQLMG